MCDHDGDDSLSRRAVVSLIGEKAMRTKQHRCEHGCETALRRRRLYGRVRVTELLPLLSGGRERERMDAPEESQQELTAEAMGARQIRMEDAVQIGELATSRADRIGQQEGVVEMGCEKWVRKRTQVVEQQHANRTGVSGILCQLERLLIALERLAQTGHLGSVRLGHYKEIFHVGTTRSKKTKKFHEERGRFGIEVQRRTCGRVHRAG
mmetsp:Transcript_3558/g.11055  ORF Transcript_3558/g.11055 Transcript_3558/m.11055 type:complete len:209 (+) Transcript_3558:1730-2356(+)